MFENVLKYCREVNMYSSSLEEGSLVVMLVTYGTLLQIFSTSRKFNNHDFCVLLDKSSVVNGQEIVIDKGPPPPSRALSLLNYQYVALLG
jgi:hypothetical protein